jgi:DNA repair protein RecO (recombination protein O)
MYLKTQAVVLRRIPYNDHSYIVSFYSFENGRLDSIQYGIKAGKRNAGLAYFEPLNVVDLVIEKKNGKSLSRIVEAKMNATSGLGWMDPAKNAIAFFLAECLYRILRESTVDRELYHFIKRSVDLLNSLNRGVANFHLAFLLQMTKYLGFYPNTEHNSNVVFFDMLNGVFVTERPTHSFYLASEESNLLFKLLRMNYLNMHFFRFSRQERVQILDHLLNYYRIHLPEFGTISSLSVLTDLFDT